MNAIVVRRVPYQETSEVIHFFTPSKGQVNALARGLHRARSSFKGPLDLLDLCEITVSTRRDGEGLALLVAFTPVHRFRGLREDIGRLQAAFVATEMVRQFMQPELESSALFAHFVQTLEALDQTARPGLVLAWFRLRALAILGLAPELGACVRCRKPRAGAAAYDFQEGGVVCRACTRGRTPAPSLSRRALDLMCALAAAPECEPAVAATAALEERTRREIVKFLRSLTAHVLERPLMSDGA